MKIFIFLYHSDGCGVLNPISLSRSSWNPILIASVFGAEEKENPMNTISHDEPETDAAKIPLCLSVKQTCVLLQIGKTKCFDLLAQGRLSKIKIDGCTRIGYDSVIRLVDECIIEPKPKKDPIRFDFSRLNISGGNKSTKENQ